MTHTLVNLAETLVVKHGNTFAVTRRDGSLPADVEHPLGIWLDDCRHLQAHELRLNGVQPRLLVSVATAADASVQELTNPELAIDGRVLPLQTLVLRLERRLEARAVHERLVVRSAAREAVPLQLDLVLRADFASMLAVRGMIPPLPHGTSQVEPISGGVRFCTVGADRAARATTVTVDPAPDSVGPDGTLHFALDLPPGGQVVLAITALFEGEPPPEPVGPSPDFVVVRTDDELCNRVLARSLTDLRMLRSRMDGRDYYAAGVPWYATLFGRDSLITAHEMMSFAPEIAEDTLRLLAARLGTRDDPLHEEEPGRVIHELRVGEAARTDATPLARYYGTVDATPLFLCLLAEHADWTGDLALFRELRPQVDAMLGWIDGPGDRNGDGLLEYAARAPGGLRNQGWKDSDEGVPDEHGDPLEPPVTLVEAAAYAVRAKRRLARLFWLDGDQERGEQLAAEAQAVCERLVERFWLGDAGFYSMGFDGSGRPSRALASNQGHLLWAGVLDRARARAVRDALMQPSMFSGWGIRTLADSEPAYNPVGYHLGTVWPHDCALIGMGLRRYGFDADFLAIFEGLLEAAAASPEYRLPELFAGFARDDFAVPVPYPVACQPQAWAAAAIPYMLKAGLGLVADGLNRRLRIRRPSLPHWVQRVEVEGLGIAGSRVDLLFERTTPTGPVALTDARIDGEVEVVLQIAGAPGGVQSE